MTEIPTVDPKITKMWSHFLEHGDASIGVLRKTFRFFPTDPRCVLCDVPFRGVGGRLFRLTVGFAPSRKNPRFCNLCLEKAPLGGAETEIGVLFADVRGFTASSESRTAEESTALLNRFYRVAIDALGPRDAIIDKLVGDQVMALFIKGIAGKQYLEQMTAAAEGILRGVGYGRQQPWLPLGVGIDCGPAFVGMVGSEEVRDFTAIGDVVNTTARLQAQAKAGQIVMSERLYERAGSRFPKAVAVELELKGKSERQAARVIDLN